jgi:hypothetical protein
MAARSKVVKATAIVATIAKLSSFFPDVEASEDPSAIKIASGEPFAM